MTNTMKTAMMGVLGLFVAAALGYLSLQLVSQPVGLSSEPLSAGNLLVPAVTDTAKTATTDKKKKTPPPVKQTQPAVPARPGSDDNSRSPHSGDGDDDGGGHHDD